MTYNVATVGLNMFKLKKNIVYTVSRQPKNAAFLIYRTIDLIMILKIDWKGQRI